MLDRYEAIRYDDRDPSIEVESLRIDVSRCRGLPEDGVFGSQVVANLLRQLVGRPLTSEPSTPEPSVTLVISYDSPEAASNAVDVLSPRLFVERVELTVVVASTFDPVEAERVAELEELVRRSGGEVQSEVPLRRRPVFRFRCGVVGRGGWIGRDYVFGV